MSKMKFRIQLEWCLAKLHTNRQHPYLHQKELANTTLRILVCFQESSSQSWKKQMGQWVRLETSLAALH
jgi:hypothetical protein